MTIYIGLRADADANLLDGFVATKVIAASEDKQKVTDAMYEDYLKTLAEYKEQRECVVEEPVSIKTFSDLVMVIHELVFHDWHIAYEIKKVELI